MDDQAKLTVFFEEPFWVGIYERISGTRLEAAKITFGAEPKDYEVYDFILKNWLKLRFSPPVTGERTEERRQNPKRMQRAIHAQLSRTGVGTKAQQALKLQHEQAVTLRKAASRVRSQEEEDRKYKLHQEKKKEKHKGR
jgi:hypothetical protein